MATYPKTYDMECPVVGMVPDHMGRYPDYIVRIPRALAALLFEAPLPEREVPASLKLSELHRHAPVYAHRHRKLKEAHALYLAALADVIEEEADDAGDFGDARDADVGRVPGGG